MSAWYNFAVARSDKEKNGKKKRRDAGNEGGIASSISPGAARSVGGVILIAFAGFLLLSQLGVAGKVGAFVYSMLYSVLGVGYLLLPLSFILLAILLFQSFERKFGALQIGSIGIFLLSGLGLISLAFPDKGGFLGSFVSSSLVASIAIPATIIFLVAAAIVALILAFDIHLAALIGNFITSLRSSTGEKQHGATEEPSVVGIPLEEEAGEEEPDVEEPKLEPLPRQIPEKAQSSDAEGGFPIIAATTRPYMPPPISILAKNKGKPEVGDVKANMNIIKRTLQNFGIQVEMDEASIGPTVTRYAMKPAEGVRLSKIVALQSNLELALAAAPVRIEAPIPGKSLVGIEVPNISRTTLGLAPLVSEESFASSDRPLLIALGRSITGQPHFADLARMPHLLVAGTTGAGKSVAIHDFIVSLLYRCGPERLRFIMVDPKRVELTVYNSIPHLLTPVITDAKKAILALKWLAKEMDRRYNILETERVRDIASYHTNIVAPALEKAGDTDEKPARPDDTGRSGGLPEAMPYIVLIIDELADIMTAYPRELEAGIVRLAQMSRAVGIHLVLSTQRPSVKVITGLIKANIPARVALQVASQIDSRTILDMGGAEKLLGSGDMLFLSGEMSKPRRIQAAFISEMEVKKVVAHVVKENGGQLLQEIDFTDAAKSGSGPDSIFASMDNEGEDDDRYEEARETVMQAGKASTSYLQRKMGIGYARAARLMDLLEERGVIGPGDGAKAREVIGLTNQEVAQATPSPEKKEEERSVFDS